MQVLSFARLLTVVLPPIRAWSHIACWQHARFREHSYGPFSPAVATQTPLSMLHSLGSPVHRVTHSESDMNHFGNAVVPSRSPASIAGAAAAAARASGTLDHGSVEGRGFGGDALSGVPDSGGSSRLQLAPAWSEGFLVGSSASTPTYTSMHEASRTVVAPALSPVDAMKMHKGGGGGTGGSVGGDVKIVDFSPTWDFVGGGSKLLICLASPLDVAAGDPGPAVYFADRAVPVSATWQTRSSSGEPFSSPAPYAPARSLALSHSIRCKRSFLHPLRHLAILPTSQLSKSMLCPPLVGVYRFFDFSPHLIGDFRQTSLLEFRIDRVHHSCSLQSRCMTLARNLRHS